MEILNEGNWKRLYFLADTNVAYEYFLRTFNGLYNHAFQVKEVSLKLKTVFNPWMTRGHQKLSERKQKLFLSPKLTKMKRNIRLTSLYLKFLKKSLKYFITRESLIAVSKI